MLAFLLETGRASNRKLRLFACACCRQVEPFGEQPRAQHTLDLAVRYADRQATLEELRAAGVVCEPRATRRGFGFFAEAIASLLAPSRDFLAAHDLAARARRDARGDADWSAGLREQADIL